MNEELRKEVNALWPTWYVRPLGSGFAASSAMVLVSAPSVGERLGRLPWGAVEGRQVHMRSTVQKRTEISSIVSRIQTLYNIQKIPIRSCPRCLCPIAREDLEPQQHRTRRERGLEAALAHQGSGVAGICRGDQRAKTPQICVGFNCSMSWQLRALLSQS